MFENDEFEIYESITKKYVIKNIYKTIEALDKHLLKIREILDLIKNRYYKIVKQTTNWAKKKRTLIITKWIEQLAHLIDLIRKRKINIALQELVDEIDNVVEKLPRKRRRRFENNEKKG